ncbi:MAG TPA: Hsp20/alpha crystallin family protein [Casimicrobiaceae bacterium]|nr:Hsp20/alpha crystallin family protein [Casimicrobiaceae bacterium]
MATLQVYDPFGDAPLEELFRGFLRPVRGDRTTTPASIKVDVKETEKGYTVLAEVPGARKDEIHVAVEGNQVTIAAEVKRESEQKDGERVLRSERYYGNLYRSFTLPAELDEEASEAKYDNGVLELKLVKKPAHSGRKLQVQ